MPPERRAGGGGREAGVEGEREGGMEGGSRPNIPCLTNRAVEAKRQAQQKACPQHCQNHPQYRHGAAAAMAACTVRDPNPGCFGASRQAHPAHAWMAWGR